MIYFKTGQTTATAGILKNLLSALLLIVMPFSSFGQKYHFVPYNTEDGLVQSQPLCFVQNQQGLLFVGTFGGLSIFDGSNFANYNRSDGLPDNVIRRMVCDRGGNIWLGTSKGISKYNGRHFENFYPNGEKKHNSVRNLVVNQKGEICALLGYSLFHFDTKRNRFLQDKSIDSVSAMTEDSLGRIWLFRLGKGFFRKGKGRWQKINADKSIEHAFVYRIQFGRFSGKLYCFTSHGIRIFRDGKWRIPDWRKNLPKHIFLFHLLENENGNIWVAGNDGGVWALNYGRWRHYDYQNGFTNESVHAIFRDNQGNVWLAANGSGIYRFTGNAFTYYDQSSGLGNASVVSITQMASGQMFFAGNTQGLFSLHDDKMFAVPLPDAFSKVTALYCVDGKRLWLGTQRAGLWFYENGRFGAIPFKKGQFPFGIIQIKGGSDSCIWLAALNGLFLYRNGSLSKRNVRQSVFSLLPLGSDSLVLGTANGAMVYKISDDSIEKPQIIANASVFALAKSGHNLFVGTDNNGVLIWNLNNGSHYFISKKNGLSCNYVYSLLADDEGDIWVETGCGIDEIGYRNGKYQVRDFASVYGFKGLEGNSNASFKGKNGLLWFGTTKGIFRYNPKEVKSGFTPKKPIPIILQSVKLFSEAIPDSLYADSVLPFSTIPYHPIFPTNQNNITFDFKAIALTGASQIRYRYQLVGVDKSPTVTAQHTVTYSSLPPGDYIFKVWASDAFGNWNPKPLEWSFSINMPYYRTIYFKVGMALILIALFLGIVYWRNRRKAARLLWEQKLREQEQDRVRRRTAEDFHDEIGNKLTRIRLLANVTEKKLRQNPAEVQDLLEQIKSNAGALYAGAKDIIWSLQPESDYLHEIMIRIRRNTETLLESANIAFQGVFPDSIPEELKLSPEYGRNLIMIFKEAVYNILKHASAQNVFMSFENKDSMLIIKLSDDGVGIGAAAKETPEGNGLHNMRHRAESIHGKLQILPAKAGSGTMIILTMPLP